MKRNIDTYQKRREYLRTQSSHENTSAIPVWEMRKLQAKEDNSHFLNKYFSNDMVSFMSAFELKFLASLKEATYRLTNKQRDKAIEIHNNIMYRKNKIK